MTTKTQKQRKKKMKPIKRNEEKTLLALKGFFIYKVFYTNHMVTTKQKSRAETQNIKKKRGNREKS